MAIDQVLMRGFFATKTLFECLAKPKITYMTESNRNDPFVSTEEAMEVDAETSSAIKRGIRDADEGRVVSSDEVRKIVRQWITKSSTRKTR